MQLGPSIPRSGRLPAPCLSFPTVRLLCSPGLGFAVIMTSSVGTDLTHARPSSTISAHCRVAAATGRAWRCVVIRAGSEMGGGGHWYWGDAACLGGQLGWLAGAPAAHEMQGWMEGWTDGQTGTLAIALLSTKQSGCSGLCWVADVCQACCLVTQGAAVGAPSGSRVPSEGRAVCAGSGVAQ